MRKILVIALAFLCLNSSIALASPLEKRDGWFLVAISDAEQIANSSNPLLLIQNGIKDFLLNNPAEANYFASELNISNGERNKNGERLMFGRLVSSESINQYWQSIDIDVIYEETMRLLFGPWGPKGSTESKIISLSGYSRALNTSNGAWEKNNTTSNDYGIRVIHRTDYFGSLRFATLKLTIDPVEVDGSYWMKLTVVRKPQ